MCVQTDNAKESKCGSTKWQKHDVWVVWKVVRKSKKRGGRGGDDE